MGNPTSKQEQLKKIAADKKALNDKQKAIREELSESKEERIAARKVQAEIRKVIRDQKAELRELCADVYSVFSKGDEKAITTLADSITESASELAGSVRKFGEAATTLSDL